MTETYVEELIRKYADGTASDEEIQRLMQWYRSGPVEDVHWHSSDISERQHVSGRMLGRLLKEVSPQRLRTVRTPILRVAAILAIFLGCSSILLYILNPSASYITVANPAGKIQMVRLPDSSTIWLNASSAIRYVEAFRENRELELNGEAFFNVTPDTEHPFNVEAGGVQTTVLGTSFNIRAYGLDNMTTISVVSGKVKVMNDSRRLAVLTPSLQLGFDRQHQTASTVAIDTNAVLAWKKGLLLFQGQSLAEIAATLEKWYGTRIIFANPEMRSCRYYMSFDQSISLEKLLSTMAQVTEMKYEFTKASNTVTFYGNGCN